MFKGYPNKDKNVLSIHTYEDCLAIGANSPHKDAAWSFLKTILNSDWQLDNIERQFPTNSFAFAQLAEAAQKPNPRGYENYRDDIRLEGVPQEDIDMIYALMNSATVRRNIDEALSDIIYECVSDYASGMTNAKDTAHILQSRVTIYVAEHS